MPFLGQEDYLSETDPYYFSRDPQNSYINANFIYNKTGYWPNELYRFGIVYILPNGQLTPVFNVRGGIDITTNSTFLDIPIYENDERRFINYNENTSLIVDDTKQIDNNPCYYHISDENIIEETNDARFCSYENVKGVCRFKPNITSTDNNPLIYYVKFAIPQDVKEELGKYVKGYFFVRQSRIPSVLAQGVTIGIDNESKTPTIPTIGGVLQELNDSLEKTHVETEDINGVNYISEGFLKRYSFYFKKKSSGFWGKIGKIAAIAALVAGTVVVSALTAGVGGGAIVAIGGSIVGLGTTATTLTLVAAGAIIGGAAVVGAGVTALTAAVQDIGYNVMRIGAKKRLNGRATKAPNGYKIVEEDNSRKLTHGFKDRIIIKDPSHNEAKAIICPDYTINQAYYNQIFTGNEHRITTDNWQNAFVSSEGDGYFNNKDRHFYIDMYKNVTVKNEVTAKVIGVPDNTKAIGLDNELFRSRAGEAEMAYKYLQVGVEREGEDKKINTDIIRGSFSPYLAINSGAIGPAKIVNIYAPGYVESNLSDYIDIRMNDNSVY